VLNTNTANALVLNSGAAVQAMVQLMYWCSTMVQVTNAPVLHWGTASALVLNTDEANALVLNTNTANALVLNSGAAV